MDLIPAPKIGFHLKKTSLLSDRNLPNQQTAKQKTIKQPVRAFLYKSPSISYDLGGANAALQ